MGWIPVCRSLLRNTPPTEYAAIRGRDPHYRIRRLVDIPICSIYLIRRMLRLAGILSVLDRALSMGAGEIIMRILYIYPRPMGIPIWRGIL